MTIGLEEQVDITNISNKSDKEQRKEWLDTLSMNVARYFIRRKVDGDFGLGLIAISHDYHERHDFFKSILISPNEDEELKLLAKIAYDFSCTVLGLPKQEFSIEKPEIVQEPELEKVCEPKTNILEKILSVKNEMAGILKNTSRKASEIYDSLSEINIQLPKVHLPKLSKIEFQFQLPEFHLSKLQPQLDYARVSVLTLAFLTLIAPQMAKNGNDMITFNRNPKPIKKAESINYIVPLDDYMVCGEFGRWRGSEGGEWGHRHAGVDLKTKHGETYGQEVHASNIGVVMYAGQKSGYGKQVVINHGDTIRTSYSHLSSIFVKEGDKVAWGQAIGLVGSTGHSSGPHVHVEFEKKENGVWKKFDILKYFSKTKSDFYKEKIAERKFINLGH